MEKIPAPNYLMRARMATSVRAPLAEGQDPEEPGGPVTGAEGEGPTGGEIPEETSGGGKPGGRSDRRTRTEHDRADRGESPDTTSGERRDEDKGLVREAVPLVSED